MPIRKSRVATKRKRALKNDIPVYTAGTYEPPKPKRVRNTKAEREEQITLRATVLLEKLLVKAEDYDRCVAYFKKNHKAQTSLDIDDDERLSLGQVVQYLVERSNQMQKTIEEIEKRERSRAEAVIAQYQEPKDIDDMDRGELEAEVYRLRRRANGIRDNY